MLKATGNIGIDPSGSEYLGSICVVGPWSVKTLLDSWKVQTEFLNSNWRPVNGAHHIRRGLCPPTTQGIPTLNCFLLHIHFFPGKHRETFKKESRATGAGSPDPGLSGSKRSKIKSARFAHHRTTSTHRAQDFAKRPFKKIGLPLFSGPSFWMPPFFEGQKEQRQLAASSLNHVEPRSRHLTVC